MVKKNLLKAKLAENESGYVECSEALSITIKSFSNKINGHTEFKIKEITSLSKFLKLTVTEMVNIFLN